MCLPPRDLNYNFQVHHPKLDRVPLPKLKKCLLRLPQIIRHENFETVAHCLLLNTEPNSAIKQSKHTQACKDAFKALQFAKTNDQRHDTVENFMLNCDTCTIAAEVPVWMERYFSQSRRDRGEFSVAATAGRGQGRAISPAFAKASADGPREPKCF